MQNTEIYIITFSVSIGILVFTVFVLFLIKLSKVLDFLFNLKEFLYMRNNKPKKYLENNFCILQFNMDVDKILFIEMIDKITQAHCDVVGGNEQISSLWLLLQMNFDKNITYSKCCDYADNHIGTYIKYY